MWFPNGSVITGGGRLLVDETFGNRVSAFDIAAPDFQEEARRNAREATLMAARVGTPRAGLP